jgi:hypothetical protein
MIIDSLTLHGVFLSAYYGYCHYNPHGDYMNLGNAANWSQVIWGVATLFIFIVSSVWGLSKIYFKLMSELKEIKDYTYKRNGGGSLMDSLHRIEARNEKQDQALEENTRLTLETVKGLSKLEGRFENHIEQGE